MPTKEEHYHGVLKNRNILIDPQVLECVCPDTLCEWHGRCRECVAIHRHNGEGLPKCLLPLLQNKIAKLAEVASMEAFPKPDTPLEHQMYVLARDTLRTK